MQFCMKGQKWFIEGKIWDQVGFNEKLILTKIHLGHWIKLYIIIMMIAFTKLMHENKICVLKV